MKLFTHPLGEGREALDKHRHIRAQLHAHRRQLIRREAGLPQMIQRHQYGCRIRGAATETATHGQIFLNGNLRARVSGQAMVILRRLFQHVCGADNQVIRIRNACHGR